MIQYTFVTSTYDSGSDPLVHTTTIYRPNQLPEVITTTQGEGEGVDPNETAKESLQRHFAAVIEALES